AIGVARGVGVVDQAGRQGPGGLAGAVRQVDDPDGVVGPVVQDERGAAAARVGHDGQHVPRLVHQPAEDAVGAGGIDLDEADEVAVQVGERQQPVPGPGDGRDEGGGAEEGPRLAAALQEVGAVAVGVAGLGDGGSAAVGAPAEPGPVAAAVDP